MVLFGFAHDSYLHLFGFLNPLWDEIHDGRILVRVLIDTSTTKHLHQLVIRRAITGRM